MHGGRKARSSSTPSQSMLTDETHTNTSTLMESACLPIGCSVSAKYRGAFCSAQVKTIDRKVKLKVILIDTNDTIIISEDQIVQPTSLRIGNTVTLRLPSSNHHDTNPHLSRSSLTALLDNYDEKQAIIKQIYDNSIYTVVFNDGDEKSLRRSSICLQGIRLYQTRIDQQKLLEDVSTPALSSVTMNSNDIASIVAVRRHGNNNQHAFPALILKRKTLSDYIWVKSFLNGREYIVHKINDVEPYKNNSRIQTLCRVTSKQAIIACDKFIKYNKIPIVWKKKKTKSKQTQDDDNSTSDSDSSTSESDFDDSDDETMEEKDSFIAQLFAFMDDRGTPINNTPKIHNYDLDLHRLFSIVRLLGGYNKVTRNDQWNKVYIKMGLPNESSPKNGRLIENTYKKYLFPYEDLSKKLGNMNMPNAYYNGRTSTNNDTRRSLIRGRGQSEDKPKSKQISSPIKQQFRKRQSIDSKPTLSSTQIQSTNLRRKRIILNKAKSSTALSSTSSDSETSDDEIIRSSSTINRRQKQQSTASSSIKKSSTVSNEKKTKLLNKTKPVLSSSLSLSSSSSSSSSSSITIAQKKHERSSTTTFKRTKSTTDTDNDIKPVIKISKISPNILNASTLPRHKQHKQSIPLKASKTHNKISKTPTNNNNNNNNKGNSSKNQPKIHQSHMTSSLDSESNQQINILDVPITLTSIKKEEPSIVPSDSITTTSVDNLNEDASVSSIFQTVIPSSSSSITNHQTNGIENCETNSNKRSYSDENFEINDKIDEQLSSPYKRSRHSMSSQNSDETLSNKQSINESVFVNNNNQLTFDDILVNDILVVKSDINGNKHHYNTRCIEKNTIKKELYVDYNGLDSKCQEWIGFDKVIKRQDEVNDVEKQNVIDVSSAAPPTITDDNEHDTNIKVDEIKIDSCDQNHGIWKSLEIGPLNQDEFASCSSTFQYHEINNQVNQPNFTLSTEELINDDKNIKSKTIDKETKSIDSNDNESIQENNSIQPIIIRRSSSSINIDSTNIQNILPKSHITTNLLQAEEEVTNTSSITDVESTTTSIESMSTTHPSMFSMPISVPANHCILRSQRRQRTFRDPNTISNLSTFKKKKNRFETDFNSNFNSDYINNSERSPTTTTTDQQAFEVKRCRTTGRRGVKRTVNQQDNENEDFHLNLQMNATLRQKLDEMFKHRTSRYNFLDLNSNLTGDNRLAHLKDRMRQCQKVFFNLKSALRKIEKQRKILIRRQKLTNTEIIPCEIVQSTANNDVLLPSSCT